MKKIIILCIFNALISTTTFGMLTKTVRTKQIMKKTNQNPKQFCQKGFNYDALLLQAIEKTVRLETENQLLKSKIEYLLNQGKLCTTEETISYRSQEDKRSNGGNHHNEE